MKEDLFFIAIIPPTEIRAEVRMFKEYALESFQTGRALHSPAHITLIPPFKWPGNEVNRIEEVLSEFAGIFEGFYIELDNFDCFKPRVIFVDIVDNPALIRFQAELEKRMVQHLGMESGGQFGFHAHMTVAFKDLRREIFPAAWAHFSQLKYQRMFKVDAVYLLRHRQKEWKIFKEYLLRN